MKHEFKVKKSKNLKSLSILPYYGGCCGVELSSLFKTTFDIERFRISRVNSAIQADVLLIAGLITFKSLREIIKIYEEMTSPKYVMVCGACNINGGLCWDSYNTVKELEKLIPVDLYINGCPPRSEAIIDGLVRLMKSISEKAMNGYERYHQYNFQYKLNQTEILGKGDNNENR